MIVSRINSKWLWDFIRHNCTVLKTNWWELMLNSVKNRNFRGNQSIFSSKKGGQNPRLRCIIMKAYYSNIPLIWHPNNLNSQDSSRKNRSLVWFFCIMLFMTLQLRDLFSRPLCYRRCLLNNLSDNVYINVKGDWCSVLGGN